MEDKAELIMKEMEDTRTSLTEKLETLEHQISEKVQAGAEVVEQTTATAAHIVESVKETVQGVTDKVEETVNRVTEKVGESVQSVASTFDLKLQTERHPWVVVGMATAAGFVLNGFLSRRSQPHAASPQPSHSVRPKHVKGANGHGSGDARTSSAPVTEKGLNLLRSLTEQEWFRDQMSRLKGLALGTMLSMVRDMVKESVHGPVGDRIAEEIESFTSHLGAEPIRGRVLEKHEAEASEQEHQPVNRLRAGGAGLG